MDGRDLHSGSPLMVAAARATDVVVLVAAVLGVVVTAAGVTLFTPLGTRIPVPDAVRDRVVGRVAVVITGLLLVALALG